MTGKTITILGNVGSGKTTLSRNLAKLLPATLINADPFETNPFLELYAQDRARWSLATELWFSLARNKQLTQKLDKNKNKNVIIDSGLAMGLGVYVKQHLHAKTMTADEYEIFSTITSSIIPDSNIYPDIAVFIDCSISVCLERISKRGRSFEKNYNQDYLQALDDSLHDLRSDFSLRNIPVIIINTEKYDSRDPSVFNDLVQQINKLI